MNPHDLPENIRRAMLRPPDPRSVQAPLPTTPRNAAIQRDFDAGTLNTANVYPGDAPSPEPGGESAKQYREEFENAVETACSLKPNDRPYVTGGILPAPGNEITFWVAGQPQPGGSKSSFVPCDKQGNPYRGTGGRIVVNTVDSNPHVKEWKATVARAARQRFTRAPHDGPVEWEFRFILIRPKAHYGSGRNAERLRDDAPAFPTGKPDCVKLCRGTEDALTGICWVDDAQVVNQTSSKRYGAVAGVEITIRAVTVINRGNATPTASQPELPMTPEPTPTPAPEPDENPFG